MRGISCLVLVAALLPSIAACAPHPATPAAVIEPAPVVRAPIPGEVARVGDRSILLGELQERARPFLVEIARKIPPGPQQAAAELEIFKELLQKMIDDELEEQAAHKAHVSVSSDEIDAALREISGAQGLTVSELVRNAARSGLGEKAYRDELARQLLEGKMLTLRFGRLPDVTEEALKDIFARTVREERGRREYKARWIVLRVPAGSSPAAAAGRLSLAEEIARRARRGEDFGALAKRFSDDAPTRDLGGDLGIRAPRGSPQTLARRREPLSPGLDAVVTALEPGQVSSPLTVDDAVVVVQLVERQASRYTTLDAARQEMIQRLHTAQLDKAKRAWIEELKARTHVEVTL